MINRLLKLLGYQVVKYKRLPDVKRTLPLDEFYVFPDGTRIYTYRDSDLALINNRYYEQTKQDLQFLQEYGIDKATVEKMDEALMNLTLEGLNKTGRHSGEVFADIKKVLDEKGSLFRFNRELHYSMWLNLYCFFFVLDGEDELHFSPAENKRKVELLQALPEVDQDFFFSWLEEKLKYFRDGLQKDITSYIMQTAEQATQIKKGSLANSLDLLTEMMPSASQPQSTQG